MELTVDPLEKKLDLQKQINSQLERDWLSTPALALPSLDGPAPPTQKEKLTNDQGGLHAT